MLQAQNGKCAICARTIRQHPGGRKGEPMEGVAVVDHHHGSGRIRGLLCYSCNMGIGMLQDKAEVCEAAARYLAR